MNDGNKKEPVVTKKNPQTVALRKDDIKKPKKGGGCCKWLLFWYLNKIIFNFNINNKM